MPKFKALPAEVDAIQWNGRNINEVGTFIGKGYPKMIDRKIRVQTAHGALYVNETDWIVKDVGGGLHVYTDAAFKKSYEIIGVCLSSAWRRTDKQPNATLTVTPNKHPFYVEIKGWDSAEEDEAWRYLGK